MVSIIHTASYWFWIHFAISYLFISTFFFVEVAGGIASGDSIRETAIKESDEEANLPKNLSDQLKPAGCIR